MEHKTYWKGITYPERIDYLSFQSNELVFVLAIEKLLALETPEKATWMRMCLAELNRIHSHLVWLGTSALEIGAISMFWYAFRERDMILDLFEMVTGVRMHTRYFQVGGLAEDIPEGFYAQARASRGACRRRSTTTRGCSTATRSGSSGRRGSASCRPTTRSLSASPGPMLRALGRRLGSPPRRPRTSPTTRSSSTSRCTRTATSTTATRFTWTRCAQSARIVTQCLDRLEALRGAPWIADDRKVVLPPREELHTSMESLIHHFKIVTEGYRVPEGEVYVAIESARGEQGCYLVSDGGPKPWRVNFRAPSFAALQATATCVRGTRDRRHDRRRRVARPRHGRRRPMSATLLRRGAEDAGRSIPIRAPRCCPALQLAQERAGGWLPEEAFREVAEALERDPCLLPLDRLVLRHVPARARRARSGRGLHERLVRGERRAGGRRGVRERARDPHRRDHRRRERSRCARSSASVGCGWATVVAVDNRHRLHVKAADVPRIVEELRMSERARPEVIFAGTNGGALTKLADYEAVGGLHRAPPGRGDDARRADRGARTRRACAVAAARSSRRVASGASSRSRTRPTSRTTSSSTQTSPSRARSRTARSCSASRSASSRAA